MCEWFCGILLIYCVCLCEVLSEIIYCCCLSFVNEVPMVVRERMGQVILHQIKAVGFKEVLEIFTVDIFALVFY